MNRRDKRLRNIKKRLAAIERQIEDAHERHLVPGMKVNERLERLYDRRDRWEEHLAAAELA